jgi:4-hydroxythreonine-4-phosphate dehydrogenase
MDTRPTIAISMGDPLGIGPEVTLKALADASLRGLARFVVHGHNATLTRVAERCGIVPTWFRVRAGSDRALQPLDQDVVVIDHAELEFDASRRASTREGGFASKLWVEDAVTDALRPAGDPRRVDAIVTAPISKESWSMAGYQWPGHTELLAHRCRTRHHCMGFVGERLKVTLATTHIPLMELRDALTIGRIVEPIDLGHRLCRTLGIDRPRIAVCGLNPHAGEGGLFGDEERRLIQPAIDIAVQNGIDARGPFPADTVFIRALKGEFDLVVAMYHDQGLIPVKLTGWEDAVNVTLGLPIVRTSPDHGTAFDIAGKGKADHRSMRAAIDLAIRLAAAPRIPAGPPLQ